MNTRTKAIISLSSVFLLGGICGALIFGMVVRDRVHHGRMMHDRDGFVLHFERQLDLSKPQRDSLHDELVQAYNELTEIKNLTSEEFNAVLDTFARQVYPQLSDEQKAKFRDQEERLRRQLPREKRKEIDNMRSGSPSVPASPPVTLPPVPQAPPVTRTDSVKEPANLATEPREVARSTVPPTQDTISDDMSRSLSDNASNDGAIPGELTSAGGLERFLAKLRKRLELTDEQYLQVERVVKDARTRLEAIKVEFEGRPFLMKRAARRVLGQMRRDIIPLLSPEQREEIRRLQGEKRSRQEGRRNFNNERP